MVEAFVEAFYQFLGFAVLGCKCILLDFQLVGLDAILPGKFHQIQMFLVAEGISGEEDGDIALVAVLNLIVVDVGTGEHPVFADKVLGVGGEVIVADHDERRPDAGHGDQQYHGGDHSAGAAGAALVCKTLLLETQVLAGQISGEHYEDGVDGEEIHRAEEEVPVGLGQSEACGAEGRHEGRGDGYSGHHRAFFLPCLFQYSGKATEQCNQHIKYGWRSACC